MTYRIPSALPHGMTTALLLILVVSGLFAAGHYYEMHRREVIAREIMRDTYFDLKAKASKCENLARAFFGFSQSADNILQKYHTSDTSTWLPEDRDSYNYDIRYAKKILAERNQICEEYNRIMFQGNFVWADDVRSLPPGEQFLPRQIRMF